MATEREQAVIAAAKALRYSEWSSDEATMKAHVDSERWHDLVDAIEKLPVGWLVRPVVLVDDEDGVQDCAWIEKTDDITADNAAEKFTEMMGADYLEGLHVVGVRDGHWMIPTHHSMGNEDNDGDERVPLDFEPNDPYLAEKVHWGKCEPEADGSVEFWQIAVEASQ